MPEVGHVRTWQDNADEFGRLTAERDKRYGWPLAVLVACSVDPGTGTGGNPSVARATDAGKVSAREFGRRAGVNPSTVLRYLDRWELAIAAGADVPPAAELAPADVDSIVIPARPFNGPGGYVSTGNGYGAAGRSPESLAMNCVLRTLLVAKVLRQEGFPLPDGLAETVDEIMACESIVRRLRGSWVLADA